MAITPEALYKELHEYCVNNADESVVAKYSRYFKGGYYAWGLSQGLLVQKNKELMEREVLTLDLIFETAPLLLKSGKYEETSFILTLLTLLSKKFDRDAFNRLEQLFAIGINNWAHADHLGMTLLPVFIKARVVTVNDFIPWTRSNYKFQRRCVPVTFIKSLKATTLGELLDITRPLMLDPEREVHQAMGWFLREAWKVYPEQVEAFMLEWKDQSPRLIFQYACEKMKPEQKLRFRKNKVKS